MKNVFKIIAVSSIVLGSLNVNAASAGSSETDADRVSRISADIEYNSPIVTAYVAAYPDSEFARNMPAVVSTANDAIARQDIDVAAMALRRMEDALTAEPLEARLAVEKQVRKNGLQDALVKTVALAMENGLDPEVAIRETIRAFDVVELVMNMRDAQLRSQSSAASVASAARTAPSDDCDPE